MKYTKTVGSEQKSKFKQLFARNHINVVIAPVFIGDKSAQPVLDALGKELLLSKEGSEIDLQPILNPTDEHAEMLRQFRGFIPDADFNALRIALSIAELEDAGMTERSEKKMKQLVHRFEIRGKHIYNLARSGFIDWLVIRLGMLKFEYYGGPQKAAQEFKPIWDEWMAYCKVGVFLNEYVDEAHFCSELDDRFKVHQMPAVYAFARGEKNVRTLRQWAENYCDMRSTAKMGEAKSYKIGENKALRITFEHKEPRLAAPKKPRRR